jgi:hypothetical protein
MRVNVYAEEMTLKTEIISKKIGRRTFTGVRFFLKSPKSLHHGKKDNDSSAVTFWGKQDLRKVVMKALRALDKHYEERYQQKKSARKAAYRTKMGVYTGGWGHQ